MDTPYAISLNVGSSLVNRTGTWRTELPVYVERTPPCGTACPAGEPVQSWLYAAEEADYETAWRRIVEVNPFPAVMGRICYHPCQTACNRAQLDEAVGINSIERFLGDEAIGRGWRLPAPGPATGKRVLVVGAGPSGLSAAYRLRRLGHEVTVCEAAQAPGGMMRYGIPTYRLPRDVLDAEIARILDLGVDLRLATPVQDLAREISEGEHDAAFIAVGAHVGRRAYVPAGEAARVIDAVSLLAGLARGERPQLGRRVAVYGGGNTAMDAARTAKRLGATDAIVIYRRTRDRMPAHDIEVQEALEEGVLVRWLSTVTHVEQGALTVERMELDESGFPRPTGELETLAADSLILALGQNADLSLLAGIPGVAERDGVVVVGPDLMTGAPGIFAGGDMVPAERTATVAVGHGRAAAEAIDAWLHGTVRPVPATGEPATFDLLNPWYFSDAPKSMRPRLAAARRASTFDEVVSGLDADTALYEARRCMSCGNCLHCDNCYAVCPDNAVRRHEDGTYSVDPDFCKGCGLCAAECPSGAIRMDPLIT
jgi:2-oxoacid:acceptor oxidoreductase delta subunit (pyruvate/2-ketoisovalerate family)